MKPGPGTASHRSEITDRPVSRRRGLLDIPRVSRRVKVDAHALNSSALFSFCVWRSTFGVCHRSPDCTSARRTLNASYRTEAMVSTEISWPPASLIFHHPAEHLLGTGLGVRKANRFSLLRPNKVSGATMAGISPANYFAPNSQERLSRPGPDSAHVEQLFQPCSRAKNVLVLRTHENRLRRGRPPTPWPHLLFLRTDSRLATPSRLADLWLKSSR